MNEARISVNGEVPSVKHRRKPGRGSKYVPPPPPPEESS